MVKFWFLGQFIGQGKFGSIYIFNINCYIEDFGLESFTDFCIHMKKSNDTVISRTSFIFKPFSLKCVN